MAEDVTWECHDDEDGTHWCIVRDDYADVSMELARAQFDVAAETWPEF